MKRLYRGIASAAPNANGMTIPAAATATERRALRRIIDVSISSPTRKRKRHSPMLAERERKGIDWLGKMCSEKPGIRPKAVGPSWLLS
jgi:hypothetical protein